MSYHALKLNELWEENRIVATIAYGGLFLIPLDSPSVYFFDRETGKVSLVSSTEQEALAL